MEVVFSKLIDQLNSSVLVLIAVLFIAFWATYKLGGIVKQFGFFEKKNENFDSGMTTIKNDLSEIKATTKLLYDVHLTNVASHSPINLTAKGQVISADTKLEEKVKKHWDEIKRVIEEKKPINPYDIQSVSMDSAKLIFDTIFSDQERDEIKTYAYNKGENILQITPIIGVMVRDKYMEEKGHKKEEIDRHDPAKKNAK